MGKNYNVFISGDIFINLCDDQKLKFSEKLKNFENIEFYFITKNFEKRNEIKKYGLIAIERGSKINKKAKLLESVLFLGIKNQDFYTANNGNMFLVYLSEYREKYPVETDISKYGSEFNVIEFFKILKLINETARPYLNTTLKGIDNFKLMSLINAKYYSYGLSAEEKRIAIKFEELLKNNNQSNKKIFISFIIVMILKNIDVKKFDNCFYYPTSRGNGGKNELMEELCRQIRLLCKKPKLNQENLFYRNKNIEKSHNISDRNIRTKLGRHMESIMLIAPERIKDKNIIVLDDYMTNGTSSEVVRELLKDKNVNNILFLTIGHFGNPYMRYYDIISTYDDPDAYNEEYLEFNKENSHQNLEKLFKILYQ